MAHVPAQSSPSVSPASSIDDLRSESSYDSEEEELRLAQQEWDESVQQLQLLLTVVVMPFLGKWLGRRWSHWCEQLCINFKLNVLDTRAVYARYQRVGFSKSFVGLDVWQQYIWS
jgi:hypothetical protein